jgi:hypothetical protein
MTDFVAGLLSPSKALTFCVSSDGRRTTSRRGSSRRQCGTSRADFLCQARTSRIWSGIARPSTAQPRSAPPLPPPLTTGPPAWPFSSAHGTAGRFPVPSPPPVTPPAAGRPTRAPRRWPGCQGLLPVGGGRRRAAAPDAPRQRAPRPRRLIRQPSVEQGGGDERGGTRGGEGGRPCAADGGGEETCAVAGA